jgi:S1-C subfamily serine protease
MEYGNVQRAIGVEGGELNATASKALGINQTEGFYVGAVTKNSGAEKSGLKRRYYRKMDGQKIATYADLSGYINTKRQMIKYRYIPEMEKNNVVPVVLSKMNSQVLNLKESN